MRHPITQTAALKSHEFFWRLSNKIKIMSKPSVLIRAILVIAPFFVVHQLPNIISMYNNIDIAKTIENNTYMRAAEASRTRTIAAEQQASDAPSSPYARHSLTIPYTPFSPLVVLLLFPSLLALAFHYIVSVTQWRGFNNVGKSAMLLHLVGLGINVWPFVVNQGDWRDAIIPSLIALIICPILALWTAITIESKGRPSRTSHPYSPGAAPDSEHISAAVPTIGAEDASRTTTTKSWPQIKNKQGNRLWLNYAVGSAWLFWLSYRAFTMEDSRQCEVFNWDSPYSSRFILDYIGHMLTGICEGGHSNALGTFTLLLAVIVLGVSINKRNKIYA